MSRPPHRLGRGLALLALLAASLSIALPDAYAGTNFGLTPAGGARFPDRSYVVGLPASANVHASDVHVRENGVPIGGVSIAPARGSAASQFGVVLVVDTSLSMAGDPVAGAYAAARSFAAQRPQQERLGVVAFNRAATTTLPLTTDPSTVAAALAAPPVLHEGTHIYDAVSSAIQMLHRAKVAAGSVVLLSDGTDTGSRLSGDAVGAAAASAHIRIFTVGLRSKSFEPQSLEKLAAAGGGGYSEAGSAGQLAHIYGNLGAQFANEYLLRYRSLAGPSAPVHVEISIGGTQGSSSVVYTTPALPPAGPPYHPSALERFWQSPFAFILLILLCAGVVGLAVVAAMRPRENTLRTRMAAFVPVASRKRARRVESSVFASRISEEAQGSLERSARWGRFVEQLEIAQVTVPPLRILIWTAAGALFAAFMFAAFLGNPLFGVLGLVAVPLAVRGFLLRKLHRRQKAFSEQLPDNLQVLASALRAGHSLVGALSVVIEDAAEPSRSEFQRVIADEQLGVSLEQSLGTVVHRMDNRDLSQVAMVAALQRDTGGNTAEVLDQVTRTIRERFELRRMVKGLTAQGRMSRWVVSLLPVGLLLALTALNPHYMSPLYTTGLGRVLLVMSAVLVISGSLVIKRIVDIEV